MNQHEWVYGCYAFYLENGYEPGNPEDGEWHAAHWPVPKCLGGTKTILLLKEHHAVQGVLQSEEWGHPCVHNWEGEYLHGAMLKTFKKWQSERGKIWTRNTPHEVMAERAKTVGHLAHEKRKRPVAVTTTAGTTVYSSVKEAAAALHVHASLVSNWLGGRRHTYVDYGVAVAWAND